MAEELQTLCNNQTNRVILWSVPRAVSTSFLKCMTFVDKSTVWHEPYLWANLCGPDGSYHLNTQQAGEPHLDLYNKDTGGIGYDAVNHGFSWVKDQLETTYVDTRLLFVKEMVAGIDGHYEVIPNGFRHSFLIRHPYKVFDSVRRMFHRENPKFQVPLTEMPLHDVPKGYFFKELWDLFQHVKQNHEAKPVIIDSDDLLANPKIILEAYCREMGIPFSESLLHWPAGEDVMYKKWKIQKEVVILHQLGGVHQETFASTGFGVPTQLPNRADLTLDVLQLSDASMVYYNALYEKRLKL